MELYTMAFRLDRNRVRLALRKGEEELLRASLPPPARFWSAKPAGELLGSLAIWLNSQLHVVLDAKDPADGFSLDLTDKLGIGQHTLFYDVVPVERSLRLRRRLRGVGDFRDLHQLSLLDRLSGGDR